MLYGSGEYEYELDQGEVELREGYSYFGLSTMAIDDQDTVFLLSRSAHPVMVFDREGNLMRW